MQECIGELKAEEAKHGLRRGKLIVLSHAILNVRRVKHNGGVFKRKTSAERLAAPLERECAVCLFLKWGVRTPRRNQKPKEDYKLVRTARRREYAAGGRSAAEESREAKGAKRD